jgi:hypothetical protein
MMLLLIVTEYECTENTVFGVQISRRETHEKKGFRGVKRTSRSLLQVYILRQHNKTH